MGLIWGPWRLGGVSVRADYSQAVETACEETLTAVRPGTVTAIDAAKEAHAIRSSFLISMHSQTSPIGLCVAQTLKPVGGSYEFYLERNAQKRYGKPALDMTNGEVVIVSIGSPY